MKIKGKIRYKILLVVIPILVITSGFIGLAAYMSAKNGITNIAKEFLGFKLNDIYKDAVRRYTMLQGMGDEGLDLIDSTKFTVSEYAKTVINSDTGGFIAINLETGMDFQSFEDDEISENEVDEIIENIGENTAGWLEYSFKESDKVGVFIYFSNWDDYFIILENRDAFYSNVNEIVNWLAVILSISVAISSFILLLYIAKMLSPINSFVKTIQEITTDMNLNKRVKIYYKDEVGLLAYYFNNMIAELEGAYNQIKNYAYQTVLAKKKEERVRFIFQKYVPQEVINQVLNVSSDDMLIGNRQKVSILFSDIRSFTTISESMKPEELVLSLNRYFNEMVSIILDHHGVVDKFIGDAIMADYGAPLMRENDAENAVESALLMFEALKRFNKHQDELGKINFNIGAGINTGDAIVGNIGSEQKIEYTVIGDTVNLASRLEGLTKKYHAQVIISQFTKEDINKNRFYYRELDNVRVKGKNEPVKIFSPMFYEKGLEEATYYDEYHKALYLYYEGDFIKAKNEFIRLKKHKEDDYLNDLYLERCNVLIENPPKDWDGVETFTTK